MLQIKGISKVYKTGTLVQQALDHVSLNLRDSEFVAILGQSGSGKTTLLNIIGGLDRYDQGDLIINGVSTRRYSSRDWDSYRNHTVGFVFQSYNLIPHQTILANVELALTISGVSGKERTRRAADALRRVGLGEHLHKRPSQLSGGQMQRVAIARALVNDPDILLADEPTGALDSDTSIQVMDLLKEVARDRLVVMVTHNPELAQQYATRIVRLRDGVIQSDSDPYEPEETGAAVHKNMGRASMSFLTALALSFNNLRTKKARTILVAFAGSIGIIGIAMILSLSTGVNRYIEQVEEETLQGYPLQITNTSFDASVMMSAQQTPQAQTAGAARTDGKVQEWPMVSKLFSRVQSNDLKSLKAYLDAHQEEMGSYVRDIEYDYGVTPYIYAIRDGKVRQVNPDRSFAAIGFSASDSLNGLVSTWSSSDSFYPMPAQEALYVDQYDVKAGRWPEEYNECVLVLTPQGQVTDLTLYAMGLKDPARLDAMVRAFSQGQSVETDESETEYDYADFLNIEFSLVGSADCYVYDPEYRVWTDRSGDETYMRTLVEQGTPVTIVGVVQPKEDVTSPVLSPGINYPQSMLRHTIDAAADSQIVRAQQAAPETDVFTGEPFGQTRQDGALKLEDLVTVDAEALKKAFSFDAEGLEQGAADMDLSDMDLGQMDLGQLPDAGAISSALPAISQSDVERLFQSVQVNISQEHLEQVFSGLIDGFLQYGAADPATDYAKLPAAVEAYLKTESFQARITAQIQEMLGSSGQSVVTQEALAALLADVMAGYPDYAAAHTPQPTPVETADGQTISIPQPSTATMAEYLATPEVQEKLRAAASEFQSQLAQVELTDQQRSQLLSDILADYQRYAAENALPDPARLEQAFSDYLATPEAQAVIAQGVRQAVDTSALESQVTALLSSYSAALSGQLADVMEQVVAAISDATTQAVGAYMQQMGDYLSQHFSDAFQIDAGAIAGAIQMNMGEQELKDLLTSLMSGEESSYEGNLRKLGYADAASPSTITIYPRSFEGKQQVKALLEDYNQMQRKAGAEDKVISYTDMVDILMSSVTDIVNAISYVLIAFVAISLVVSSIMIGVITYISVLERKKEIGILRAIGASKRNVSEVFNAETFIIGALAGLFGIGLTELLLIPANHIIRNLTNQIGIRAVLPPQAALILIALSIVLTLIGGIIPSQKAAHSDPVAALRSE